ncbi:MAG: hypothetical protein M1833_004276 [Piccolia ochrophora]|nr:MAG: hypothetical protein M1833_004276 [Piccolia ochrophora]
MADSDYPAQVLPSTAPQMPPLTPPPDAENIPLPPIAEGTSHARSASYDSAYGAEDDLRSNTTSIPPDFSNSVEENGRRYHTYHQGSYLLPTDEVEKERLDLEHKLFRRVLKGKLHLAPISPNIQTVLDVGTGTGIWAMEFADKHRSALVEGIDLSEMLPTFVPPNVKFVIDDAEETWKADQSYDFIFVRGLNGCLKDWPRFYEQSFKNTTDGGWIEVTDIDFAFHYKDDTKAAAKYTDEWHFHMMEASKLSKRPLDAAPRHRQWMEDAGFVEIQQQVYTVPINVWHPTEKMRRIGRDTLANILKGLSGSSLARFTRFLKWSPMELEVLLAWVRTELKDTSIHANLRLYVTYGRKPTSKS